MPRDRRRDRYGRWFEFSDADIRDAHENIQKMLKRGVPIPLVFEHVDLEAGDDDEWRANYARHCFGHAGGSRISKAGSLEVRHDVVDPEDVKRLRKCKFVSPKIRPGWWDSKGGEYTGATVTHIALTPSPVQYNQKPFELSDADGLFLSYADSAPAIAPGQESSGAEKPPPCPGQDWWDDWLAGLGPVELSATEPPPEVNPVADEKSDDKGEKKDGGDKGGGKNADLKMIIEAIQAAYPEANIPTEVSNWNELALVLKAQKRGAAEAESEPEPEPEAPEGGATSDAGGPPMLMSTLDKNPARRKQAELWAKDERDDARARIEAALKAGKLSALDARRLSRQAGAVEMSFLDGAPTGKRWGKLLADIEAAEKGPVKFKLKSDGTPVELSTVEVERPKLGGEMTDERASDAAAFIAHGVRPKK